MYPDEMIRVHFSQNKYNIDVRRLCEVKFDRHLPPAAVSSG